MDKKEVASKMGQHSSTKPANKTDAKLSIQHLHERIKFNEKHVHDHDTILKKGGSWKYNKDHIKHHQEQIKEDSKLIKERAKMLEKAKK
jgi:hypothetical protein